ncbi:MAG TPA: NUDIX domain-containing protein [Chloroflexota bacterium]|nr:NUDIX domain-containing protein [Chloroflexota bacterium]
MSSDEIPFDPSGFPDPGRPRFCARCGAAMEERDRGDRLRPVCPACGWTYYAKNALGAAVLVERATAATPEVLLVQRAHDPYKGDWMLPAGFVEYGEDAAHTAVREAHEECALRISIRDTFGLYFGTDDPRNPSYLIVYRATRTDPTQPPTPGDDACAAAWFTAETLPTNIAFEAHRHALADWKRGVTATASSG